MKKKLWCVLCIMICMMMIAACGQKKNPEKKKSEKAEQEETEFKDRESLKLSLFTVYYPQASGKSTVCKVVYFCQKIRDYTLDFLMEIQ